MKGSSLSTFDQLHIHNHLRDSGYVRADPIPVHRDLHNEERERGEMGREDTMPMPVHITNIDDVNPYPAFSHDVFVKHTPHLSIVVPNRQTSRIPNFPIIPNHPLAESHEEKRNRAIRINHTLKKKKRPRRRVMGTRETL
jgi:hypothetical protein